MKITPDFTRLHSGENQSRVLHFSLSEKLRDKSVKLCFVTPLGRLFVTDPLTHNGGEGEYKLPSALLDGKGVLLCQLICTDEDGFICKSPVLELPVFFSADDMTCPALSDESLKSFSYLMKALDTKTDIAETERLLKGKSDADHLHKGVYLTLEELMEYLPTHPSAGYEHTHDGRYYTKEEADSARTELDNKIASNTEEISRISTDVVVEQGTVDGWSYRKWSSGIAECWSRRTVLFPSSNVAASGIANVSLVYTELPLPFTFAEQPCFTCSCAWKGTNWLQADGVNATARLRMCILNNDISKATEEGLQCMITARGRWK